MKHKLSTLTLAVATLAVLLPATASAHIRLDPAETVVGRQTYWIRVPNEKDIATTSVRLEVPKEVDITGVLAMSGWQHTTKTEPVTGAAAEAGHGDTATTRVTEITWTGGMIKDGEYMLFGISTNYTGKPTELSWKAYQTYEDGTVVAWDDSNKEHPAPKVNVEAVSSTDRLTNKVNELQLANQSASSNDAALWVAIVATLLGAAALFVALKKRQS